MAVTPPGLTGGEHELLRRLELEVNRRLDGILHGDYRGLVAGHGSDPGDAREYAPGDDIRRIDWNATARTTVPHVRDTIADRELETRVLVDLSPSLEFGTAARTKRELGLIAVAAMGFITARQGNRFGVLSVGTEPVVEVPARAGRLHLLAALRQLQAARPTPSRPTGAAASGPLGLAAGLHRLGATARRRGLVVVVSDLLAPPGWSDALSRLALRHEVLVIEVVDPRELDLPSVGVLTLVDPETGRTRELQTSDRRLRDRYRQAAAAQRADHADLVRRAGADHLVLGTDGDWLLELVRFVATRRRRLAVTGGRPPGWSS